MYIDLNPLQILATCQTALMEDHALQQAAPMCVPAKQASQALLAKLTLISAHRLLVKTEALVMN